MVIAANQNRKSLGRPKNLFEQKYWPTLRFHFYEGMIFITKIRLVTKPQLISENYSMVYFRNRN